MDTDEIFEEEAIPIKIKPRPDTGIQIGGWNKGDTRFFIVLAFAVVVWVILLVVF